MKQFTTAARRGEAAVKNAVDVTFEFEVKPDEFVEMTASPPTSGQLALFTAHQFDKGSGSIRAMFDLLAAILSDEDYGLIEEQLHDGLDVMVLVEIVQWLIGEWTGRPTTPRSDSSGSRRTTGTRSTVKPRSRAGTSSR